MRWLRIEIRDDRYWAVDRLHIHVKSIHFDEWLISLQILGCRFDRDS